MTILERAEGFLLCAMASVFVLIVVGIIAEHGHWGA